MRTRKKVSVWSVPFYHRLLLGEASHRGGLVRIEAKKRIEAGDAKDFHDQGARAAHRDSGSVTLGGRVDSD